MSDRAQRFESGADTRARQLDREIRQLEARQSTWRDPLLFARLQSRRSLRDRIERRRLSAGWAARGTDGAGD